MKSNKALIRPHNFRGFKPSRRSPLSDDESDGLYVRRDGYKTTDHKKKKKRSIPSNLIDSPTMSTPETNTTNSKSDDDEYPISTSQNDLIINSRPGSEEDHKQDTRKDLDGKRTSKRDSKRRKLINNDYNNSEEISSIKSDDESSSDEDYSYSSSIPPELLNRFKTFSLFQNAPKTFFAALARSLRLVTYNPQEYIVKAGEQARSMYWILRGTVGVTSTDGEAVYAELAAGSFFGEIGILFNRPRTATVVARTKVLLGVLTKDALSIVLYDYPTIERLIRDEGQERLAMQEKRKRMTLSVNRLPQRRDTHFVSSDNSNALNASGTALSYDQVPGPSLPPLSALVPHPYERKHDGSNSPDQQSSVSISHQNVAFGNAYQFATEGSNSQNMQGSLMYGQQQQQQQYHNQQLGYDQRPISPSQQIPTYPQQQFTNHQIPPPPPPPHQQLNNAYQQQNHHHPSQMVFPSQPFQYDQQHRHLFPLGASPSSPLPAPSHSPMLLPNIALPQGISRPSLYQQSVMQDALRPTIPLHQFINSPVDNIDNSISTREFLRSLPIFKTLPSDLFHELALSVEIKNFKTMEYIFRKGSVGRDIYFVVFGEVEVLNPDIPNRVFARLGSGKYFGEMAFLTSLSDDDNSKSTETRSADIRAVSDCEVLIVKGHTLEDLCKRYPTVAEDMKATAGERLKINDSVGNLIHSTEITPQDRITVDSLIASHESDIGIRNQESEKPSFRSISWRISGSNEQNRVDETSGDLRPENHGFDFDSNDPLSPERVGSTFTAASAASSTTDISADNTPFKNFSFDTHAATTATATTTTNTTLNNDTSLIPPPQARKSVQLSIPTMNPTGGSIYRYNNPPRLPFQYTSHDHRLRLNSINHGRRRSSVLINGPLPDSLFLKIFSYLNLPNLMRMSSVCRRWKQLIYLGSDLFKVLDLTPWSRDLNDEGLIQITNFVGSRPEVIDISSCFHITDESFSYLINEVGIRGSIKKLIMKNNWNISAMAIMDLSIVGAELNTIDLSNCRKVKDDVIERLISSKYDSKFGCQKLTNLNLSYCKYLSDKTMMLFATNASDRLTSLDLTRCTTITDNGYSFWAQTQFPQLQRLILRDCTFLSDNAITSLASSCPNLRELDLTFCCVLTDNSLAILYLCCKYLTSLNLSFCGSAVSDNSLVSISRLPYLEKLLVTGCIRVTRQGVDMLLSNSKSIKYLDLSQCPRANVYQGTNVEPFEKKPGTRDAYLKVSPFDRIVKVVL